MGRLTDERPRLQTGPGKFGRPALSGGLRKRSHGGNEIPTRNRKSGLGNPPPTAGASEFYPNQVLISPCHGSFPSFARFPTRLKSTTLVERGHRRLCEPLLGPSCDSSLTL